MKIEGHLDVTKFNASVRDLAQISGKTFDHVLRQEAASICKICARATRPAKASSIRARALVRTVNKLGANNPEPGGIAVTASGPNAGRIWYRHPETQNYRLVRNSEKDKSGWHFSNAQWGRISKAVLAFNRLLAQERQLGMQSQGLSRQAWVQVCDAIGVDINSVGPGGPINLRKIRTATGSNGKRYNNGSASFTLTGQNWVITLTNAYPGVLEMGGTSLLQSAINRRASAFRHALRKGVFDDIQARASRYPGIFVTGN